MTISREYLVRADGTAVVVVPASVAARLNRPLADLLRQAQRGGAQLSSDLVAVAWAIDGAASIHHQARAAGHTAEAAVYADATRSEGDDDRISTAEAAEEIGCTERNVRALAQRGTLPGERTPLGWALDAAGVSAYARNRARQEEMS